MLGLRFFRLLAACAAALLTSPAFANDLELDASGAWTLNYANDSCRLSREFGRGDDRVTLILDQFDPVRPLSLSLVGKPFTRLESRSEQIATTFGPSLPDARKVTATVGELGIEKTPIVLASSRDLLNRDISGKDNSAGTYLQDPTPDQLAAITRLQVSTDVFRLTLNMGSMRQPIAALQTCIGALVRDWGLDPAQQSALSRRPLPLGQPGYWLTSADYPRAALEAGSSAIINFRLLIGPNGMPTSCHIQQATMSAELIRQTCSMLMRRARFKPALDAQGKPVPSYYTNSVRWLTFK